MKEFLRPGRYIDSAHPGIIGFSTKHAIGETERQRAVSLYYAVRDQIRYNPFLDFSNEEVFKASSVLGAEQGFCVGKAALLAACVRAAGIPARVGFADVKNHLTTPRLAETMGSDLFVYHGYADLYLEGRWVKATPAFNLALCTRFRVKPLEFDGRSDSIFHPFDADNRRHMEYLRDRGRYADVPVEEIQQAFRETYPKFYRLGPDAAKRAFAPRSPRRTPYASLRRTCPRRRRAALSWPPRARPRLRWPSPPRSTFRASSRASRSPATDTACRPGRSASSRPGIRCLTRQVKSRRARSSNV